MHRQRHRALLALSRRGSAAGGFTLIELMVTIAIVAILATIAVPSFREFARSSRLTSVANNLVGALQSARTEAMKRNRNVMLQPIDATDWRRGWIIFVDTNFNGSYAAAEGDILVTRTEPSTASDEIPGYIRIESNPGGTAQNFVLYDGSGFSRSSDGGPGTVTLQLSRTDFPDDLRRMRRIKINTARVRTCTPASGTDATCTATGGD